MDERLDLLMSLLARNDTGSSTARRQPAQDAGARVPVWVGGSSQAGAVARRAARADGVVPYKLSDTEQWSDYTSEEIAQLAAAVAAHRLCTWRRGRLRQRSRWAAAVAFCAG